MQKFIEKYFNIGHDASASIMVTLIVFILGYLFTLIAIVKGILVAENNIPLLHTPFDFTKDGS